MKIVVKILGGLYSLVTIFLLFFGFGLAFVNIGKEEFIIFLTLGIIGAGMLLMAAIYIFIKKKGKNKAEQK